MTQNQVETEYFMIKALPDPNESDCLDSFLSTVNFCIGREEVKIVEELGSREETLNKILQLRNTACDLFVFVDDIRFNDGWLESLREIRLKSDIVGFSMVDPKTGLLQDFGYDFVKIDNDISYMGLYKHVDPSTLELASCRECASVCGCAMWISKRVLDSLSYFPLDGANRWGEMLFTHQAKRLGFKTMVSSVHLDHFGTSTKLDKAVEKSSISWLVEREMWSAVVRSYLFDVEPSGEFARTICPKLDLLIQTAFKVTFYGCGTVAEFLSKKYPGKVFTYVSALPEEIGAEFCGKRVQSVYNFNGQQGEILIVTPIGYRKNIEPELPLDVETYWIDQIKNKASIIYTVNK